MRQYIVNYTISLIFVGMDGGGAYLHTVDIEPGKVIRLNKGIVSLRTICGKSWNETFNGTQDVKKWLKQKRIVPL
jgi:hypothetical protein